MPREAGEHSTQYVTVTVHSVHSVSVHSSDVHGCGGVKAVSGVLCLLLQYGKGKNRICVGGVEPLTMQEMM